MSKQESPLIYWPSRPEPVVVLGSLCMGVLMISYFIRIPGVINLSSQFSSYLTSLEWFAILVAAITMIQRNVRNIMNRNRDWIYMDVSSLLILTAMWISYYWPGGGQATNSVFFIFNVNIRGIASTAPFAMHGFLVASAMFRVLKANSTQRLAGMILMFTMMLYQIPLGDWMWPGIAGVGDWLQNVVSSAANRAFDICTGIGMFILGIRILVGKEWNQYGLEERKGGGR